MNTYEGDFSDTEKLMMDTLFGGWTFKHVGKDGQMPFYYADKGVYHYSSRNLGTLAKLLLSTGHSKDEE